MDENKNIDFSMFSQYYQNEFTKITNSNGMYRGKFNIFAFLFSWIWLMSKGMIGKGIVVIAIDLLIAILVAYSNILSNELPVLMSAVAPIATIIFRIIILVLIGTKGNYMYYKHVVLRLTR